jgi:hypothetical protein
MATVGYGCVLTQRQLSGVYGATPPHRHNGHSLSARQQWQSSTYKYAGRQATPGSLGMRQQTALLMPKQKHPASLTAWPRNRQHPGYVQSLSVTVMIASTQRSGRSAFCSATLSPCSTLPDTAGGIKRRHKCRPGTGNGNYPTKPQRHQSN